MSLSAAVRAGAVHYVETGMSLGKPPDTTVGDASSDRGKQQITDKDGTVVTIVDGKTAYFKGDKGSLVNAGFTESEAAIDQGKWITIHQGSAEFDQVTFLVTLPTVLSFVTPNGALQLVPQTTIDGQRVTGVTGASPTAGAGTPGEATLYISESSDLPVAFRWRNTASPGADTVSWIFSDWGKPVVVVAPTPS